MNSFISYKILPQKGLILNNFQNKIQVGDLIKLTLEFMKDPLYNPDFNLLMDFRGSMAIVFRMELADYIEFFKKNVRLNKTIRVAILYTSPNHEFLLKIYKPMAKLFKMDVEKFKDINEAMLWLGINHEDFYLVSSEMNAIKSYDNCDAN